MTLFLEERKCRGRNQTLLSEIRFDLSCENMTVHLAVQFVRKISCLSRKPWPALTSHTASEVPLGYAILDC